MTLFLAYAAADRERALALAGGLRQAGYVVDLDEALAGDSGWWSGVLSAVQGADAFLFASSPSALAAPTCLRLRDYAAALGIPTLLVHLDRPAGPAPPAPAYSRPGAPAVDFSRPDAEAAFRLVGAVRELPSRPSAAGWQPRPDSPFDRIGDLVRDVTVGTLGGDEQRRLVDRLIEATRRGREPIGGDETPAVRELAAIFRGRSDLDAATGLRLAEAFDGHDRPAPRASTGVPAEARRGDTPASGDDAAARSWGNPPTGMLTDDDVRRISFRKPPIGRRGYDEQSVDEFLDLVEADLRARRSVWTVPEQLGSPVVVNLVPADVQAIRFARSAFGRRGYDEEEVDSFLDEIERSLSTLDAELNRRGAHIAKHAGGAHSAAR